MATLGSFKDKYSFEYSTYPTDLFGAPGNYGNSWVMININALESSKFMSKTGAYANWDTETVGLDESEKKDFSNTRNTGVSSGAAGTGIIAAAGAAGGIAAAAGGIGRSLFENLSSGKGMTASAAQAGGEVLGAGLRGGAAAGFAAAPMALTGTANRQTKRLKAAIALPMPYQLSTGYTADWDTDSTAMFNAVMRAGGMLAGEGVTKAFSGPDSIIEEGKDAVAALSLGAQSFVGAGGISAASGMAFNPKREMIFRGMDFRNFTLEYRLYPKTHQEQAKILKILSELKFHMHPEYQTEGRYTFLYPSEFDITFYNGADENLWINRIATCVLKGMTVNYTPDGVWAQHQGGAPNAMQLTLNFQELSILTKEAVLKGF
jgi:hypothetical protein